MMKFKMMQIKTHAFARGIEACLGPPFSSLLLGSLYFLMLIYNAMMVGPKYLSSHQVIPYYYYYCYFCGWLYDLPFVTICGSHSDIAFHLSFFQ
jgi:hypothetical protein